MIKIKKLSNQIIIEGHAMYEDYGKDIVCAAVSSIVITTVNACLSIDSEATSYNKENDRFTITIKKQDPIIDKLIQNMMNLLTELEQDYPKNIRIK